ncbi:MAG: cation diffusion facilitator family transporter, partial [Clostridiales bacterium]|nr:cation diffusion facilitator family transporter [Clostridiales bacterium]
MRNRIAGRATVVSVAANGLLTAFKALAGILGHSYALVSDAVDSAGDVAAALIAWAGVRVSNRADDAGHPYGHERFECVAAILLSVLLLVGGIAIGYAAV